MTAFIDEVKDRFGVEPVCRVLTEHGVKIAPSTFYAAKSRPPSPRAVRDERVLAEIHRVWADRELGRGLAGARKVYHLLRRDGGVDGVPVPRCQVERLMRSAGLQGVRRGRRPVTTTRPDPAATRAPDLVERDFSASRPNQLWLVDFTYVPTWSGMAFTAFVSDACSRRIDGVAHLGLDAHRAAAGRAGDGAMDPAAGRPGRPRGDPSQRRRQSIHSDSLHQSARRRRRGRLDRFGRGQLRLPRPSR